MAWPIILRTPLIGSRVSRAPSASCDGRAARAPSRRRRRPGGLHVVAGDRAVGPVPTSEVRSTPRSLASLRTGGLASGRAPRPPTRGAAVAGTAGSSGTSTTSGERDAGLRTSPCSCCWVAAAPAEAGTAAWRARRTALRSALLRPTSDSPSPPPLAAGLERSISGRLGGSAGSAMPGGSDSARRADRLGRAVERVADRDDRRADRDGLALGHHQPLHDAGERRRQLDQRLRGLDLDHDLVDGDGVALLDLPGHDLGLGETLAHVGQLELGHGGSPQKSSVRSTASSTRSRSGR